MNAISIGEAVQAFFRSQGFEKRLKEADLFRLWPLIVGESIAAQAVPVRIEKGKLFVHVENSTWRAELSFMEAKILDEINRRLGNKLVNEIVFK